MEKDQERIPHYSTVHFSVWIPWSLVVDRFSQESQFSGAQLIEPQRGGETLQLSEGRRPHTHISLSLFMQRWLTKHVTCSYSSKDGVELHGSAEGTAQLRSTSGKCSFTHHQAAFLPLLGVRMLKAMLN